MTHLGSEGRELISTKIDRINHKLKETEDISEPISLSVGVAFSDREKPGGNVFQDADIALERMKEIRTSGYAVY